MRYLHIKAYKHLEQHYPDIHHAANILKSFQKQICPPLLTLPPSDSAADPSEGLGHFLLVAMIMAPPVYIQNNASTSQYLAGMSEVLEVSLQNIWCVCILLMETAGKETYIDVAHLSRPDWLTQAQSLLQRREGWAALLQCINGGITELFDDEARSAALMANLDLRETGKTLRQVTENMRNLTREGVNSALDKENEIYDLRELS